MKKIVRTVWISALTGLAFLVACTSGNRLTRAQKKQLKADRSALVEQLERHMENEKNINDPRELADYKISELSMRSDLAEIDKLLKAKEDDDNTYRIGRLNYQLDSLQDVIRNLDRPKAKLYGPPIGEFQQIRQLQQEIDSLRDVLKKRESACVYGSPEVMERRRIENNRIREQIATKEQQLNELKNE